MTTVVAIDPSLTGTGLCTWRDGRFYLDTIHTTPNIPAPERHHRIVMRVLGMAPDLAVIEARIDIAPRAEIVNGKAKVTAGQRGNSTLDLAELRGVIMYGLWSRKVPVAVVHPATLKAYATGNGGANKQAMLTAARGRLGEHFFVRTDDEADAAFLLAAALDHYGAPLWRPPAKQRAALDRITWPAFSLNPALATAMTGGPA